MIDTTPSKAFSSGTEYQCFLATWCDRCRKNRVNKDGHHYKNSCAIERDMSMAQLDLSKWPANKIVISDERRICLSFADKDEYVEHKRRPRKPKNQITFAEVVHD